MQRTHPETFVPRRNFAPRELQKDAFSHKPSKTPSVQRRLLGNSAVFVPQNGHHISRTDMVDIKPTKGPDGTHGIRITSLVWEPTTTVFGPSYGGGRSTEARRRAKAKARRNSHRR